jgi:hypothetical protein
MAKADKFDKELIRGIEIGERIFVDLVDRSGGKGATMIIAISAMAAQMEAQSPGTIEDIVTGANLMTKRLTEILAKDVVDEVMAKVSRNIN